MKYLVFFVFLLSLFLYHVPEYFSSLYDKPVPEIIASYGYPSETHSIYTADDYNLILHRIPYGRHCKKENSTPVLILHGAFQSSLSWLYLGPENSLGFLLADDCYDVWLANARGNCYSRGHKHLSTNQAKYWEFSYHEMGIYDISAMVDYMVNVTNQNDVLYIGFSQGGAAGFVNAIRNPENKIRAYFFLAPVSYVTKRHLYSRVFSASEPILSYLTQTLTGNFKISWNPSLLQSVEKIICNILPQICSIPFNTCGSDNAHFNQTAIAVQFVQACGVSLKQLLHIWQGFSLDFSEYDYGTLENTRRYGADSPPKYNVEDIIKPVYLYYAREDLCGDAANIERLAKELGNNLAKVHLVDDLSFDHIGFTVNVRVKELLYDVLMSHMREVLH